MEDARICESTEMSLRPTKFWNCTRWHRKNYNWIFCQSLLGTENDILANSRLSLT